LCTINIFRSGISGVPRNWALLSFLCIFFRGVQNMASELELLAARMREFPCVRRTARFTMGVWRFGHLRSSIPAVRRMSAKELWWVVLSFYSCPHHVHSLDIFRAVLNKNSVRPRFDVRQHEDKLTWYGYMYFEMDGLIQVHDKPSGLEVVREILEACDTPKYSWCFASYPTTLVTTLEQWGFAVVFNDAERVARGGIVYARVTSNTNDRGELTMGLLHRLAADDRCVASAPFLFFSQVPYRAPTPPPPPQEEDPPPVDEPAVEVVIEESSQTTVTEETAVDAEPEAVPEAEEDQPLLLGDREVAENHCVIG